jgi:hypothetical protein
MVAIVFKSKTQEFWVGGKYFNVVRKAMAKAKRGDKIVYIIDGKIYGGD